MQGSPEIKGFLQIGFSSACTNVALLTSDRHHSAVMCARHTQCGAWASGRGAAASPSSACVCGGMNITELALIFCKAGEIEREIRVCCIRTLIGKYFIYEHVMRAHLGNHFLPRQM